MYKGTIDYYRERCTKKCEADPKGTLVARLADPGNNANLDMGVAKIEAIYEHLFPKNDARFAHPENKEVDVLSPPPHPDGPYPVSYLITSIPHPIAKKLLTVRDWATPVGTMFISPVTEEPSPLVGALINLTAKNTASHIAEITKDLATEIRENREIYSYIYAYISNEILHAANDEIQSETHEDWKCSERHDLRANEAAEVPGRIQGLNDSDLAGMIDRCTLARIETMIKSIQLTYFLKPRGKDGEQGTIPLWNVYIDPPCPKAHEAWVTMARRIKVKTERGQGHFDPWTLLILLRKRSLQIDMHHPCPHRVARRR
jgi:hypothetical protein